MNATRSPNSEWLDIHKWVVRHCDDKPDFAKLGNILRYCSTDELTPTGSSPLHLAALGRKEYVLSFLLPMSTINHQNQQGCTPLHYACRVGNIKNVCLLLKMGARGDITDNEKNTPLHYAVEGGHLNIVEYLVTKKCCDIETVNMDGRSALDVACKEGELKIASFLIASKAPIFDALIKAIRRNHPHIVVLFAKEINQTNGPLLHDEKLRNPLHLAVLHNRYQIVRILIKIYMGWLEEKDSNGLTPRDYLHEFSDARLVSLCDPDASKYHDTGKTRYFIFRPYWCIARIVLSGETYQYVKAGKITFLQHMPYGVYSTTEEKTPISKKTLVGDPIDLS